ncbi:hypothetical protein VI817_000196 [Penicillium citrinum]|nr:hypothetical protein VI817_000150 [Penicillium citrinum]KAK5805938.1 hypothetical protein VI817_000196 [Penicillium citrinum]
MCEYIEKSWEQQSPWNASTQKSLKATQEENARLRTSVEKLEKQVDILWKERGLGTDGPRKAGRPKRKAPPTASQ